MTSQPTTDSDLEGAKPLPQDNLSAGYFGSSMYGGRPTFALTRRDGPDGARLTLYELLPEDQAAARSERLERSSPNRGLVIESFDEVFDESADPDADRWSWDDWTAVKVTRLSESRLGAILPLVRETLDGADLDDAAATSGGRADVFLPRP